MRKLPRVKTNCLNCNIEFEYLPSYTVGKYCGLECYHLHNSIEGKCLFCKKLFRYPKSRLKQQKAKYCSKKCYVDSQWKGGTSVTKNGYIRVNKTRELEHRMVMENHLSRKLTENEIVHHKNGIKNDNHIENLEIVYRTTHFGEVKCPHCLEMFKIK